MANKFASVEWLSQSSREDTRNSSKPKILKDIETSTSSWTTLPGACSKVNTDMASGSQRMTSSPWTPNSDSTTNYLMDFRDSSCTSISPGLSPVFEGLVQVEVKTKVETACSPACNDQDLGLGDSGNTTTMKPTSNEDLPTSVQEKSENQPEKKGFNEDATNSSSNARPESGYESESSRSGATSPVDGVTEELCDEEGKSSRRMRTAFTTEQISTLESTFQKHKYLGAPERRKLAAKLQLSEVQIKTWFQNRRMKLKREVQEGRQGQFHPGQVYGVYGFPPAYPFAQPVQPRYVPNPLLEPLPINYNSQAVAPVLDHLGNFSHQKVPVYLPRPQTVMPPPFPFEEQHYVRY